MQISINKLAEVTGKTFRTVKNRLASLSPVGKGPAGNLEYDSTEALPMVYDDGTDHAETDPVEDEKLDFSAENVRLIALRADAQAMKNAELRSKLIPASAVDETWGRIVAAAVLEFEGLPDRIFPMLQKASKPKDRRDIMDREIRASLTRLADTGCEKY